MTTYTADVDDLLTIFERHKKAKDPLSIRIFRWGAKLFQTELTTDPAKVTQVALERLKDLVENILIAPIGGAPLQDPIVEREWVWERWMYLEYHTLFDVSPLDDGPWIENPPDHHFAKEMLFWANHCSEKLSPHRELTTFQLKQDQMVALAKYPQFDDLKRFLYQQIAQAAVAREKIRQIREDMEWGIIKVDDEVDKMQALSNEVLDQATGNALQTEQHIQQQLEAIERVHDEAIAVVKNQMSWLEKIHAEEIASLERRFYSQQQTELSLIVTFKSEVQTLKDEILKLKSSFENKLDFIEKAHATAKAGLESQLTRLRQDNSSARSSIAFLEITFAQTHRNLQQAKEELKAQKVEINRLNSAYESALCETRRLKDKIEDFDPCVIL